MQECWHEAIQAGSEGPLVVFERILAGHKRSDHVEALFRCWQSCLGPAAAAITAMGSNGVPGVSHDDLMRMIKGVVRVASPSALMSGNEALMDWINCRVDREIELRKTLEQDISREADLIQPAVGRQLRQLVKTLQTVLLEMDGERKSELRDARRILDDLASDPSGRHSPSVWLLRGWVNWVLWDRSRESEDDFRNAATSSSRVGLTSSLFAREFLAEACLQNGDVESALKELGDREGDITAQLDPMRVAILQVALRNPSKAMPYLDFSNPFAAVTILGNPALAPLHAHAVRELVKMDLAMQDQVRKDQLEQALTHEWLASAKCLLGEPEEGQAESLESGEDHRRDVFVLAHHIFVERNRMAAMKEHWSHKLEAHLARHREALTSIRSSQGRTNEEAGRMIEEAHRRYKVVVRNEEIRVEAAVRLAEKAGMSNGIVLGLIMLGICGSLWVQRRSSGAQNPIMMLGWTVFAFPVLVVLCSQGNGVLKRASLSGPLRQIERNEDSKRKTDLGRIEQWRQEQETLVAAQIAALEGRLSELEEASEAGQQPMKVDRRAAA